MAGGTGLAPIKSMIRHALENEAYEGHLTLYQGGRSREWLYDVDEFRRLEAEYPEQFTYRPCLSEETAEEVGADARGLWLGLVTDVIAADHAEPGGLSGLPVRTAAHGRGGPEDADVQAALPRDIYREDFFDESDKATGGVRSPLIKR